MMGTMRIFALDATRAFGEAVAGEIGAQLDPHEESAFEDGEHKIRPLVEVRGRDVYVIQSLHGDASESVSDKLLKLLFFAGVLRENHAARVTAVIPYLAYSRKDRQTRPRDPVTTRYLAQLLEAMGLDMVVTLDVHNLSAFQNAFRIGALHLDTRALFAAHIQGLALEGPLTVAAPDPGGVRRVQLFREVLERRLTCQVASAYVEKRSGEGDSSGTLVAGELEGATVLVLDDMISTGQTVLRTARACLEHGAARVLAYAAHGLFTAGADQAMLDPSLSRTVITDTVAPSRLSAAARERVEVVSAAPHFSRAIRLLHEGGSLVELIGD